MQSHTVLNSTVLLSLVLFSGCARRDPEFAGPPEENSVSATDTAKSSVGLEQKPKSRPPASRPAPPEPRPDDVLANPIELVLVAASGVGTEWTGDTGSQQDLTAFIRQLTSTLADKGQQTTIRVPLQLNTAIPPKDSESDELGCFIDEGDLDTRYVKKTLYILGGNAKLSYVDDCVIIAQGDVNLRYGTNCIVICGGRLDTGYCESSLLVSRHALVASYPTDCLLASTTSATATYATNVSVINQQPTDRVTGQNPRSVPLEEFHFVLP